MAEKTLDSGIATFGTSPPTDVVGVKLKITDDTIAGGSSTSLQVTLKNLSGTQLPGVQVQPVMHSHSGAGPDVYPAIYPPGAATLNLDVGEEETCSFVLDNSGNTDQARFSIHAHISGIPGYAGPPFYYSDNRMDIP